MNFHSLLLCCMVVLFFLEFITLNTLCVCIFNQIKPWLLKIYDFEYLSNGSQYCVILKTYEIPLVKCNRK